MNEKEQKLRLLLLKIAKGGRSTSWSHEQRMTSTRSGVLLAEEYQACIFKRHSCRIDVLMEADSIDLLIEDLERFVKEKQLDWNWDLSDTEEPF